MKPYQTKRSRGYSKYHNNRVLTPYGVFDRGKEYQRFMVLLSWERCGKITDLRRQVWFDLLPSQKTSWGYERPVKYKADFVYSKNGKMVVEDVKGYKTPDYIIKRKLMLYIHGIEIREV